jgi:regulator of protease activity HflC (stomatin/prohibitin superfamily)
MSNIFTPRTGNPNRPSTPGGGGLRGLLSIPIIIVGVIALVVVYSSFIRIDEGDVGVKLRFGQAVDTLHPGLQFLVPFVETVVVFSTRTQKRTYREVATYSKDIQEATNLVSINYRVEPAKVIEVYSRYGIAYADSIIDPVVYKRFKEVFGKYDAREIVNLRDKLGLEIENSIKANMPSGLFVEGVQIENIDFSDDYEKAIEGAAQAEAAVRKARQELEQKKVDAEKVVVQATADATARVTAAKAEADAIRLRGEAEAAALQAKAAALRDNPSYVALTAAEKWDGKLPQTFVPGSTVPFVTIPRGSNP